ncbi:cysteine protease ATG4C isoform X2 [Callorhinchus milii]|uniref:cysteine protease ATG4C isoform X2 n=1 Tax=Callorhinchus milii TaxID=7868 RepID=UPI000457424E|nr:cysteine protease ATG4C isoform X2 [Callorhinchus milii]|eukprot:gi/632980648/ref/XP_007907151.1/ PREDICTED: cysteine protease ATG4C isoform X2 [Callorhinchus milii]
MEDGELDEVDKLKTKILTAWHNVKYSWHVKTKTSFSRNSPVFLLGKCYHFKSDDWVWADVLDMDNQDSQGLKTVKQGTLERSEGLYRSLVEFSGSLKLSRKTNDDPVPVGSEQQGHVPSPTLSQDEICHRKIISWFADLPHPPFGMHRLTEVGKSLGKKAGDWYGPAVVAHIIRKALQEAQEPELQGLAVYVAQDCTVYVADLMETHSGGAVILLIPVRLGGEKVNSQYQDIIKGMLSLEFCIGIMGGKPKQSLYFVGFQDDSLIYLDPHCCQPFVDVTHSDFPIQSFHCSSPKKMPFSKMDPSCTIGFYCGSNTELGKILEEIRKVLNSPASPDKYPLFSFSPGHAHEQQVAALGTWGLDSGPQSPVPQQHSGSQEFVFL